MSTFFSSAEMIFSPIWILSARNKGGAEAAPCHAGRKAYFGREIAPVVREAADLNAAAGGAFDDERFAPGPGS